MKRFLRYKIIIIILAVGIIVGINMNKEKPQGRVVLTNSDNTEEVMIGGYPIGIYLKYDGVLVAKTGSFRSETNDYVSPCVGVLKKGDIIRKINGTEVIDKLTFTKLVSQMGNKEIILNIERNSKTIDVAVSPQKDINGVYKLGIWVRDDTQGIGTITYITNKNKFGALGHGVNDVDSGKTISIHSGLIYNANIVNIKKGVAGNPGEILGNIHYNNENLLGSIIKNTDIGIYGNYTAKPIDNKLYKVAKKHEVKCKKAYIVSYIDGERKEYEIRITDIDASDSDSNRAIAFRVTDKALINQTNGIIQGMSGSPIIQDGKIIGAVTHVLVNDPTKGYGIFIENMLEH